MRIIIIGAGKVGEALCRDLAYEGNDVVLIEEDEIRLNKVIDVSDITGLVGNGAAYDVLVEAQAESADVFIAVTDKDEINIISCILGKKIGAGHTIARVRNPEYFSHIEFVRNELGISLMINPEFEAAHEIMNSLRYTGAITVESFSNSRVNLIELEIEEGGVLDGICLKDFRAPEGKVIICVVVRGEDVYIPDGNFVLQGGDRIHVTGTIQALAALHKMMGFETQTIKSVMIIGGGRLTHYLMERLTEKHMKVKVFESDEKKALELASEFPQAIVIHADGTDQELLREEGISHYDAFISLTGIDEENIIASMFAQSENVPKTITKTSRNTMAMILEKVGLDSSITPKRVIADIIIRFVRSLDNAQGSNVITLHRLADNKAESLEFQMAKESEALGIMLKDLKTISNAIIAYIIRGTELIFPGGNDALQEGDRVMVVTTKQFVEDFDDILDA